MRNDFKILHELLKGPVSEVAGREAEASVDQTLKDKIMQFIRGELSEEQRQALCREIVENEAALQLTAALIQKGKGES
jgi:hypothetical protein